ncbi:MAG: hypothetical protein IRZ08_07270 [Frankia sp.]|nr:hypothetical protein [Frankia sp.]
MTTESEYRGSHGALAARAARMVGRAGIAAAVLGVVGLAAAAPAAADTAEAPATAEPVRLLPAPVEDDGTAGPVRLLPAPVDDGTAGTAVWLGEPPPTAGPDVLWATSSPWLPPDGEPPSTPLPDPGYGYWPAGPVIQITIYPWGLSYWPPFGFPARVLPAPAEPGAGVAQDMPGLIGPPTAVGGQTPKPVGGTSQPGGVMTPPDGAADAPATNPAAGTWPAGLPADQDPCADEPDPGACYAVA